MKIRACQYCGMPLPVGASVGRLYCCERHRREYQNERRREERAEARELRDAEKNAMPDPWARNDLDEWTAEEMYANALLDPSPVEVGIVLVSGPMAVITPKKKKASWKDKWLWLW